MYYYHDYIYMNSGIILALRNLGNKLNNHQLLASENSKRFINFDDAA